MNAELRQTKGMRGPGIFLAQFMSSESPFHTLSEIAQWAASQGYKAIQIPTLGTQFIDLERAAESQDYCDELIATCARAGVVISELSTHLQGQLVAVHPAFDAVFDDFALNIYAASLRLAQSGQFPSSNSPPAPVSAWA